MQNTTLSPPWLNYVNEIKALFGRDPEISILYDDNANEVKLYVEGGDKANALAIILPPEKHFGNVTLKITVVPANDGEQILSPQHLETTQYLTTCALFRLRSVK